MGILVTGHRGFVGGWMLKDKRCVGLDNAAGEGIDLLDVPALVEAVARIKPVAVVHLAAQSAVPESFANPAATFNNNVIGTQNLLQALKLSGFSGRFLFVSTAEVYGQSLSETIPTDETCALKPLNPYAVSKVAAEALCNYWNRVEGLEIIIARPFNHIGPGQSTRFAIADFAHAIAAMSLGQKPPVLPVGDLDVTRDFTDVRDVISAYHQLLETGTPGETYNVCSGTEQNMQQAVQTLARLAGVKIDIQVDTARLRKSGQRRACGSSRKLMQQTSWHPQIDWETSLNDILNHWKQQLV
jgi:GDP-4-dehydro-6-deoxy-D-mannose reductase